MKRFFSLIKSLLNGRHSVSPIPMPVKDVEDEVTQPIYVCNCLAFTYSNKPQTCQHVESAEKEKPS